MSFLSFINALQNALQKGALPGHEAQNKMASGFYLEKKIDLKNLNGHKLSAVCLLLYEKNNTPHFLLIKRPDTHRYHAGQIALPGGKCEPGETYEQTALRELTEETGIEIPAVNIIGRLTPMYIPVSNFYIQPIVAYSTHDFSPVKTAETEHFLEYPLKDLLNERIVGETEVKASGQLKFKTPYFHVQGFVLWGATAMMLSELKELLKRDKPTFSSLFQ
ncbi:MAG TPA: CoA pyrophosphatase [Bacteroidia bacterium]|nr:CoA pyrophosphatase [Bacteroidia bacterium]